MCGICGIFRCDGAKIDGERVLRMRDAMVFRGPDGCGFGDGPGFALAHRRLSIIDLSDAGQQPMWNEDKSVGVVFNGEIYNFLALRPLLERSGHRFASRTDTEVLVHGYEEWGLGGLLERIRGMYAFAIVDTRRSEIHLARDPLGKKPLFFAWANGELTFASSARALLLAQSSTPNVNPCAVDDLLWNRCIGGAKTVFAGVEKLLPGHAWSLGPDHTPRKLVHWRPNFFDHDYGVSAEEWLERIEDALQTAVTRRLVADVPIGVMLSGGVDSGLVAVMAAKAAGRIKTFCVGNEDPAEDESAYARAVAERYGTDHHLLPVKSSVRADLPRLIAAMGEPFADVSAVNLFAIAQVARQSVTVVLTGDGGDEGFGGYTEFWAAHRAGRIYGNLPPAVRSLLGSFAAPMQRGSRLLHRAGTFLRMATMPLEKSFGDLQPRDAGYRSALYTPEFMAAVNGSHPREHTFDLLAATKSESWCDRIMQAHLLTVLPDDFLPKVDLATMGASLEARSPFLDIDLIELAMRIPAAVRLSDRQPKGLLRRLARKHLPPAGVDRRKQGFSAPVGLWFRKHWQDLTREFILGPHVEQRRWFRRSTLERLVDEHNRGRNHGNLLWALLVLELWMKLSVEHVLSANDSI